MSKIKLIIFDFDGTLGNTRRNITTTMRMAIKEIGLPERSETECASTIGLPLAGCIRALFPDIQDELVPRFAETYRRIFNENLQHIKPTAFPGVIDTLSALHQKGYTLTIASSRSRNSLTELTHDMGIADYITYMIGADDVKEAKPKPEPVLKTLDALKFEANETLVVGDMAVDILMGANAGTKTCGVTWGNGSRKELQEAGAEFIIESMNELIEKLFDCNPKLHKKTFQELTTDELYELLRVRSEVFVVEQNCVYQDMDGDDQKSIHLWLTVADKIVALARICPAGTHMKEISIGRVITTERGKGYGKQIMLHAIDAAIEHFDATLIDIEAQEYAKGFYESVGFKQSSDTFMLDGIPHIKMTWK